MPRLVAGFGGEGLGRWGAPPHRDVEPLVEARVLAQTVRSDADRETCPGLDPVALALEGVARQDHPAAALAGEKLPVVDLRPQEPQLAEDREQ